MRRFMKVVLIVLVALIAWTGYEVVRNAAIDERPSRPDDRVFNLDVDEVLVALEESRDYDSAALEDAGAYVSHRYDCSDFRLQSLARILYLHRDTIDDAEYELIKRTFLEFKYWMDQPGEDGMCFWSENHQLMFAASEYLAASTGRMRCSPTRG